MAEIDNTIDNLRHDLIIALSNKYIDECKELTNDYVPIADLLSSFRINTADDDDSEDADNSNYAFIIHIANCNYELIVINEDVDLPTDYICIFKPCTKYVLNFLINYLTIIVNINSTFDKLLNIQVPIYADNNTYRRATAILDNAYEKIKTVRNL